MQSHINGSLETFGTRLTYQMSTLLVLIPYLNPHKLYMALRMHPYRFNCV